MSTVTCCSFKANISLYTHLAPASSIK